MHVYQLNYELYTLTSSKRKKICFYIVTVHLCSTEDDGLVHLVSINGPDQVLSFEELHSLREGFRTLPFLIVFSMYPICLQVWAGKLSELKFGALKFKTKEKRKSVALMEIY